MSSDSTQKLSRDDDLYQDVFEERVVENSESEIVTSSFEGHISYSIETLDTWKSLKRTSRRSKISRSQLLELVEMDDVELAKELGYLNGYIWKSTISECEMDLTYNFKVKRYDNEEVWVSNSERVSDVSESELATLAEMDVESIHRDGEEYVLVSKNSDMEITLDRGKSRLKSTDTEFFEVLLCYVSAQKTKGWVDAEIVRLEKHPEDNSLRIVIQVESGAEITEWVSDPKDSGNIIWELVDILLDTSTDILLLEGEEVSVKPLALEPEGVQYERFVTVNDWLVCPRITSNREITLSWKRKLQRFKDWTTELV